MSRLQRRYFGKRRTASRRGKSFFSRRRGGGSSKGGDIAIILGAAVYGAGRDWASNKLTPITTPLVGVAGQYADEIVMGGLGYLLMKGKIPLLNKWSITRDIGKAALIIESARIGASLGGGLLSTTSTASGGSILYNT
jgi:hypothetical protein